MLAYAGVRCLYVDLDGTLLGPRRLAASRRRGRRPAARRARAGGLPARRRRGRARCPAAARDGREDARLFGQRSYIFEAGSCLVLDGEEHWLTGDLQPDERVDLRADRRAPARRRCCSSTSPGAWSTTHPWHLDREVSHLFRGLVDAVEADALLAEHGHRQPAPGRQRRDARRGPYARRPAAGARLPPDPGGRLEGARRRGPHAGARLRARGLHRRAATRARTSRVGAEVGTFWLVANAIERDPTIRDAIAGAERHGPRRRGGLRRRRLRGGRHDARRTPMSRLPAALAAALVVGLAAPAPAAVEQAPPPPRIERLGRSVAGPADQRRAHRRPGRAAQGPRRRLHPRQRARGAQDRRRSCARRAAAARRRAAPRAQHSTPTACSAAPARTPTSSTSTATRRRAAASSAARRRLLRRAEGRSRSPRRARSAR